MRYFFLCVASFLSCLFGSPSLSALHVDNGDEDSPAPVVASAASPDSPASDTLAGSAQAPDTPSRYLAADEFSFAGDQRYLIDGSRPLRETSLRPIPSAIVGGSLAAAIVGLHVHQRNAWWSGQRGDFHIQDDWDYAVQADKVGHFTAGYILSYFTTEGMLTSGFNPEAATIIGSLIGLGYHTYVEIEDGYARDWGFSPSDMAANALGAGFFVLQHYVPALQSFQPKWMWVPTKWTGARPIPHETAVVDDYNASTFWMSIDIHNLLPQSMQASWLPWLNIAVGYAARNVGYFPEEPTRHLVIALDYNMVRLLPEGGSFWNWIRQSMNMIKFPAPAIEFGPTTKFRLLYPF